MVTRSRNRSRSAQRVPQTQGAADHDGPGHARDHRPGRQHRDRGPRPRRPWLRGCVVGACSRRVRHNASMANSGSNARPTARPARYSELDAKVSVMVPGSPAGTSQPCCQPLTATGVNRAPLLVRATQPGLMLSGMTSTREAGRRRGPHLAAARTPAPGRGDTPAAPARRGGVRGRQLRAVHDELGAGADQEFLLPRRQRNRRAIAGQRRDRCAVQQRTRRGPDRGVHEPAGDRDDRARRRSRRRSRARGCGRRRPARSDCRRRRAPRRRPARAA